ncbi:hypothetical protein niasHT_002874 [Heterodera trifolii]|uniref:BTB domain-containing protein n=1 Tax=Heterodera trifolii TaxID=157864 RepID=A0ABD2LQX8_9BILA
MSKSATDWIKLMLSTGEYADVHFLVGDGDEKELVPAHKIILKKASDVFEAMFRFDSKNAKAENASANCPVVEMPDVEPAAFKLMLSFIYADDLNELNGDNAMAVLYAAKKYNIPGLIGPCLDVPVSELCNIFMAYAQARLFDLEDFANDCLAYIEKNAHTLIKSEEFLQIDQKLLCEIFGCDQLQIREEISIWEACSAENRRQMLGPALYKIRFPRVQKMEFSEKIVPFGMLTAEEVTSIEQYHSPLDFRGISNGILYPLQFPCHGRISPHGTIVMDIKKFSEFAREAVKSHRYSKTVQIMGFGWRIMAEIRINIKTKEKLLGIFLFCKASKEDSCLCSATFRIVTQNVEAENCIGKFNDIIFKNKSNGRGFANFITLTQLMDPSKGFYNREEDKVTLAIDLIVKNAKVAKFTHDLSKSDATISMEIEKFSEFSREIIKSERKSESVTFIKGLPWKILAQINQLMESNINEKGLGIYLQCAAKKEEKWSCKCSAIIRIVSQKCDVANIRRVFDAHIINNEFNDWGFSKFITFAHLLDPSNGFYNREEDKVTLVIDFTVKEAKTDKS